MTAENNYGTCQRSDYLKDKWKFPVGKEGKVQNDSKKVPGYLETRICWAEKKVLNR